LRIVLLAALACVACGIRPEARMYQQSVKNFIRMVKNNPVMTKEAEKQAAIYQKSQDVPLPQNPVTNCEVLTSPSEPTSVHRLMPSDIDIVAAIGDSITAGNGVDADTIFDVILQNRGKSWCIGGDDSFANGVVTLTSMLQHFNPNIQGYSTGEGSVSDPNAGLNVAIPGEIAEGIPDQAVDLVTKMQDGANWDYQNDWKIITLLIGGNDLCRSCFDRTRYSAANFVGHIERALDYLQANVPRALVNLHPMFDITPLPSMSDNFICDVFQDVICGCATDSEEKDFLQQLVADYATGLRNLVASGKYDTREDFTVVYQSHTQDAAPPRLPGSSEPDRSYWSPDCFHPGTKGHYAVATSLWNSMFEPVGSKRTSVNWDIGTNMICPTAEKPYIYTRLNSNPSLMAAQVEGNDGNAKKSSRPLYVMLLAVTIGVIGLVGVAFITAAVVKKYSSKRRVEATTPSGKVENPAFENTA